MIHQLERLIALSEEILQLQVSDDSERFLALLDDYLEQVERLEPGGAAEIPRELVEKFLLVHGELIARAQLEKGSVLESLSDLQKRTQMLRSYLTQVGERISITGKRRG